MSGNNGQKISVWKKQGQTWTRDQMKIDGPGHGFSSRDLEDTEQVPEPARSRVSFWRSRSVQVLGLYLPFMTAAGVGIGKTIAPDLPTSEVGSLSLWFAGMSSLFFPEMMNNNPPQAWRTSFKKAAMTGAVALAVQAGVYGFQQHQANNAKALPQISIKDACAAVGAAPGARVRTESADIVVCP